MKKRHTIITALVLVLLVGLAGAAQAAGGAKVNLSADKQTLTVGDPVRLTLEVEHPAGEQVIIPKLGTTWGAFEIREQSPVETTANDDGTETTRQTLTAALFEPGTFETPALELTLTDAAGQLSTENVPPVSLTVKPVLAEGDTTLDDIRPQVDMRLPAVWPLVLGGVLAVAALAGGGWWLYRHRRPVAEAVVDLRPPYQVAFDELDRIKGLGLPEQGWFKMHYTLVADCLRGYLENQFQLRAFDRTTSELGQILGQSNLAIEHRQPFINLFKESDLVKFAKLVPELEEARQLVEQARRLVEVTKPRPEAEPEAAAQAHDNGTHNEPAVEVEHDLSI